MDSKYSTSTFIKFITYKKSNPSHRCEVGGQMKFTFPGSRTSNSAHCMVMNLRKSYLNASLGLMIMKSMLLLLPAFKSLILANGCVRLCIIPHHTGYSPWVFLLTNNKINHPNWEIWFGRNNEYYGTDLRAVPLLVWNVFLVSRHYCMRCLLVN
jgi:hypothetical protein